MDHIYTRIKLSFVINFHSSYNINLCRYYVNYLNFFLIKM